MVVKGIKPPEKKYISASNKSRYSFFFRCLDSKILILTIECSNPNLNSLKVFCLRFLSKLGGNIGIPGILSIF